MVTAIFRAENLITFVKSIIFMRFNEKLRGNSIWYRKRPFIKLMFTQKSIENNTIAERSTQSYIVPNDNQNNE